MSVGRTWLAQRVPAPLKLIIKDQFHRTPQSVENLSIPSIITVISNNPGVVYRQPARMLIGHISVREDHHPHISPKWGGQFWQISYCSTVPVIHCIHVVLRSAYIITSIDPWLIHEVTSVTNQGNKELQNSLRSLIKDSMSTPYVPMSSRAPGFLVALQDLSPGVSLTEETGRLIN